MDPTPRLAGRVHADFGADSAAVLALLSQVPETLPLADRQSGERLQAALVLPARGDLRRVRSLLALARRDWRDVLVAADLADGDWPQRLDRALGDADEPAGERPPS